MTDSAPLLLKTFINAPAVKDLANLIDKHHASFKQTDFLDRVIPELESLSLTQRVQAITSALTACLPDKLEANTQLLLNLAADWPVLNTQSHWQSYLAWPVIEYAGKIGIQQPVQGLFLLKQLTALFTAEFAIRPYVEQHFELTYETVLSWTHDEDVHVRRLASEGLRPRLPWGKRLTVLEDNPEMIIQVLERLKHDEQRYVQKSVANTLNDISKKHSQQVVVVCQSWQKQASPQTQWIIRHGLRSLIKAGDARAFEVLGFSQAIAVTSRLTLSNKALTLGETTQLNVTLNSNSEQTQTMIVDYRLWQPKARGKVTAKVFKWKTVTLKANQSILLTKSHAFKQLSTRRYYQGDYQFELLINGLPKQRTSLYLQL